MLTTSDQTIKWIGFRVVDVYGTRLGRAAAYVANPRAPDEDWILIRCGRLTNRTHRLAPFTDAIVSHHEIWLPTEQSRFEGSPAVEPGAEGYDPRSLAKAADYYLDPRESPHAPAPAGASRPRRRPLDLMLRICR